METQLHASGESLLDVIIVGAGISGIGTAYWLQKKCPGKRYAILEARERIGGTWDLFRYPGIRSDSDMFTFGYRFKPWENPKSLSDGESIRNYLKETAEENGIVENIYFGHKVLAANWEQEEAHWSLQVAHGNQKTTLKTRFLYMCSGYYSYEEGYRPGFEGEASFEGRIIHPQFWPEDLDYSGKKIAVIGSGATAVTLVPSLAEKAAQVTMVQRSPTYIMKLPNRNGLYIQLKKWLPRRLAYRLTRWRNLVMAMGLYGFSRAFPERMKGLLMKGAAAELPEGYPVEKHFNPTYNPWDQRLCVIPDGDLFKAIKSGKAGVVTGEISHFTSDGIRLKSGEVLEADIIITATGLKMKLLGGAEITIDGKRLDTHETLVYKGMMMSGVPNFALAFGYTNNSWTLKTDLTANLVCRILTYMDRKGYEVVVPVVPADIAEEEFLPLDSGYMKRAKHILPKNGSRRPWRVYQNYLMDMLLTRFGRVRDRHLQFDPRSIR
ncbi:MAG: NAD(P)/FAD-dependent oxidoreductase [Robiginitalea sp.]